MDWNKTYAAIYRARKDYLKPIFEIDPITLKDLVGMESQKALYENTLNSFKIREQITHFYGDLRALENQV